MMRTRSLNFVFGSQPSFAFAFAGIADEQIDFRRPLVAGVVFHVFLPVESDVREGLLHEFAHGVRFVRREHVIVARWLLEHPPHALDVFRRVTPVALGVEVAEEKRFLLLILIAATARVILRVTNVSPRRGLS